jgi:hypothetical protein
LGGSWFARPSRRGRFNGPEDLKAWEKLSESLTSKGNNGWPPIKIIKLRNEVILVFQVAVFLDPAKCVGCEETKIS